MISHPGSLYIAEEVRRLQQPSVQPHPAMRRSRPRRQLAVAFRTAAERLDPVPVRVHHA